MFVLFGLFDVTIIVYIACIVLSRYLFGNKAKIVENFSENGTEIVENLVGN